MASETFSARGACLSSERKTLVYQAYGLEDVMRQTMFSVSTLLGHMELDENMRLVIYTDQKKRFVDYFGRRPHLEFVDVTMDQIKKWRGSIDFVHRVKVEILIDAAEKNPGALFYCDGDTYFISSPKELFGHVNDRQSLMHIAENALDAGKDPLSKKILKFVRKNQFRVQNEWIGIGASTVMWNAGVLGLSEKNKALLGPVLALTDQTYGLYKKHVMEQLAFSFYLQTKSEILPANDVIYHYWNQKAEFQIAIDDFFKNHPNIEKALQNLSHFAWPQPPMPKEKKSWRKKLLRR